MTLSTQLRRNLESTIRQARKIAESGARHALETLAVHEPDPYQHMDEAQRALRRKLRAQARQLGDGESQLKRGAYEIKHLAEKIAYDQWHRMLFARYLLENNLLISPAHGVAVSLGDCEELAPSEGLKDAWAVAGRFATVELPEIFRADDPAGAVDLSVNDRKPLIQLVTGLPVDIFTASDSLGWCYQFWQSERKDEVNASGNKIGADELPSVTQLFTEDYMVDFLLDNTLGAWRAGKVIAANPKLAENAQSEDELRRAVALPGCPWNHLRFFKGKDTKWTPAAGTFDSWPQSAADLRALDPCMGSGHFVVAMFERLVALRLAEEELNDAEAVAAVIRDNLFGLELDPRCTQIGAFNLALAAWRRVGYCKLPAMNLACSGLAPNTREADWLAVAGENEKLGNGMKRLYRLFQKAAVLGSLINPRAGEGDLYVAAFHELRPLLEMVLAQETEDDTAHEMAVTARGLAKAAEILASQFTLVATNVPYLGRGKQDEVLMEFCERIHPDSKADLATCFVERCLDFCARGGTTALVSPQNWLFLTSYYKFRLRLLQDAKWNAVAKLGPAAFRDMNYWAANTGLTIVSRMKPGPGVEICGLDVSATHDPDEKGPQMLSQPLERATQLSQIANPDARITLGASSHSALLQVLAEGVHGMTTGDLPRMVRLFWEASKRPSEWEWFASTVEGTCYYGGRFYMVNWNGGEGPILELPGARKDGQAAWGKSGVLVSQMNQLSVTLYSGELFDNNSAVICPENPAHLPAIWAFCASRDFYDRVREIDQQVKVTNSTLVKIPFDMAHWQKLAADRYPHGLPKPFSSDPTQWLFNGHPVGADQPLHVAVARLLGYRWPRQTGSSFPDCPGLGSDSLEEMADDDGIVCISSAKGEDAAAERLRELLARAYGQDWSAARQEALLAQVNHAGVSMEEWLRSGYFEQHCALFHHRPFIWHIWDGHKSGFSALVNYHKLTRANLEKLTFAYLGDWIRRQQAAVAAGEAGSDAKLQAARQLQGTLKLILEGEPPYDIFVRWKPLSQQAIGWHPDINDGVRMNIRPFLKAPDVGKKGAGILRAKPNVKWEKDRGKEPVRDKKEFPWFWGWDEVKVDFAGVGKEPDGNRWNGCHYTTEFKLGARR
jgi:hypothetical protein